ncbi:hypothetical protein SA2016_3637 [Sinomonas atrocyanea]|uniref:DUF305 domain-containing protein n=1 Tax=Sinomonas atrocyanea TaxID=37927 RepID=A0A127A6N5_9MICC|nr:DUF305 domain-containing protein [Sinomonas atrocyanea]AMM34295.1 hypothetical protein SA2016_3637 [Sinomonas atrocyanea]GEB65703.1 DUF305 domain-containing protein [Sinomonas atrocyanea]GGG81659.1 DUF305 domain-containing protein [Sinomonas atrocyanea]
MNAKTFALPAAALLALALAGCGATAQSAPAAGTAHDGHTMPMSSAPSAAGAAFNAQDVMFAQMMVPHHEQAVEMSEIVLAKPGLDGRVSALAQQIKGAQAPEIATLKGWLGAWNQPSAMPGDAGHGMEGMLSAEDLGKLRAADSGAASRLFLSQMIAHHEGAIAMARTEKAGGAHPDAVAMAGSIVDSQAKEVASMKDLLDSL